MRKSRWRYATAVLAALATLSGPLGWRPSARAAAKPLVSQTSPTPGPSPAPGQSQDFNFDLLGRKQAQEARDPLHLRDKLGHQARTRRIMLQFHQGFGFAMLASMAATLVLGQLNYNDRYLGDDTRRYYNWHLGLAVTSGTLFAATGALALFAPNPYPKPIRLDSALVHKVSMIAATACIAAQLVLGPIIQLREGKLDQKDYALAHLIIGYSSYAFMTTGVLAYVF